MVHTTAWDIEMHYYLTASSRKGKLAIYPPCPGILEEGFPERVSHRRLPGY